MPAGSWTSRSPAIHYNRLNNPTVDVLEQRVTALEGGAAAMAVSSGAAAVSMSVLNLVGAGDNFVSVPQLYGATYTYFAHVLPRLGVEVRFAADDRPESIGALIDGRTKAVFCETVGNPAGNVIDLAARRRRRARRGGARDRRQHRGDAVPAQADPSRRRHRGPFADQVHRRPRHDDGRDGHRRRHVPVVGASGPVRGR